MATDVQAIKDKIDIVQFIGEYVELKPAGSNHKGRCPFHGEKTPSFMVHRDRQFWHCFGCGKGGDVFTFVQEMEGVEFIDALRILAEKAGIPLESIRTDITGSQRNRLKDILLEAARFFHHFFLQMPASQNARAYLSQRGLTSQTIDEWQIGYSPEQWDLLTKYLLKKGHSIDDLVAAGLTIQKDGADIRRGTGYYDRFRSRVMFPIWDVHGAVVGFTGRVLVETEYSGGKYVNTPQTMVYDKSRIVYGLNKAKQEIKTTQRIVMVEGQMDVIACHQAGMKNVVATSGTALTQEQISLLKRYANTLAIAFDADAAGQAAAKRGIDIALEQGMDVRVIRIPEGQGKDPDECVKKNKEVWFRAVEEAANIMDWYVAKAFAGKNMKDPKQKQAVANEILPEILRIPYAVERDHWLRLVSEHMQVDVSVLREDMERLKKQPGQTSLRGGVKEEKKKEKERSRMDVMIERLFSLILSTPSVATSLWEKLPHGVLSTSAYGGLYESVKNIYTERNSIDIANLRGSPTLHNQGNQIDILLLQGEKDFSDYTDGQRKKEIEQLSEYIRNEWTKERRKQLEQDIVASEKRGDKDTLQQLLQELQELSV
ncbi:MAG TPA: DNA primase [Candidatus Kapabacteria bacterium]|nr:DNA primase [Candidatus Kapabacteria bacterium]